MACRTVLARVGVLCSSAIPRDRRVHVYDIRREAFSNIEDWLDIIHRNYRRRHPTPTDPYTRN